MSGVWGFHDGIAERASRLADQRLTERQARFLVTVMVHSGVFLERQYCHFAGIAHGQKSHDFISRLVRRGLAREISPGARHRGRLFHVHHKPLYEAIGQTDNRNRRRAPLSRMVERLMLLDSVLDDPTWMWLGTEIDKVRYFHLRLAEYRVESHQLPHLSFGSGANTTLRMFPDKLPVGVDPTGNRHVFTYLVTRPAPADFRAFLVRHHTLLDMLYAWRLRILVPEKFEKAIPVYRHAAREELVTPIEPWEAGELRWWFEQRQRATTEPAAMAEPRFVEAAKRFTGPRFSVLFRLWQRHGASALADVASRRLVETFDYGQASVEFVVLSRQYLHLAHLVGVA